MPDMTMTPAPEAVRGTAFMYSGQGSQYPGMGRELFDGNARFRSELLRLDAQAREILRFSVIDAMFASGPESGMERTVVSHPAIYMCEVALTAALADAGIRPDLVLGSSLGIFAAAVSAEALSADQGLRSVIKQALALEACCEPGGMLAILDDPGGFAALGHGGCTVAAVNFASHYVVAGPHESLDALQQTLRERGTIAQRLPVTIAFHSVDMDDAGAPFLAFMQDVDIAAPRLPIYCAALGARVASLDPARFWCAVRDPLDFPAVIASCERIAPLRYVDVGPSGTLATFLKYLLPSDSASQATTLMTPYAGDSARLAAFTSAAG